MRTGEPNEGAHVARTRASYDRIARSYKEQLGRELDDKPFDRAFLERVSGASRRAGLFVDLGCGPGQIGGYLAARGHHVVGVDLSLQMLHEAGADAGGGLLTQADMRFLPLRAGSVSGLVALYSLIHIAPDALPGAVAEIARALGRGGVAGMAVHSTQPRGAAESAQPLPGGGLHLTEMLSHPVALDFFFYGADQLAALLEAAGLEVVWARERDPYPPPVEVQTRRAYLIARKPS